MYYQIPENQAEENMQYLSVYDLADYEGIEFGGRVLPKEYWGQMCHNDEVRRTLKGVTAFRLINLAIDTYEAGIKPSALFVKKLIKQEHKGKAEAFISSYLQKGLTKCEGFSAATKEELENLFHKERRFRGRVPQILPVIASVCDYYNLPVEEAVSNFSIQYVRNLLTIGVSAVETVLLYMHLNEQQLSGISNNLDLSCMVASLINKSFEKSNGNLLNAADWLASHSETDLTFLKKIYNNASDLKLDPTVTVENVETQFGEMKSMSEVAKVEKAYKKCGFKLKNCVCELKQTLSETDRYQARILDGKDPMQVMLGYYTDCCQHLGEAGESSMMHGLLNPKAGFWVVIKKDSGKVVAQAEAWELDENTLVFDNIEFANDAEIHQYKEIVGKWLSETPYANVVMGAGYNEFIHEQEFEPAGAVVPPVTPYELYVLSYEKDAEARDEILELESVEKAKELMESGSITYFDYVYCDSENYAVYMKHDYHIDPFFEVSREQQKENISKAIASCLDNNSLSTKFAIQSMMELAEKKREETIERLLEHYCSEEEEERE